MLLTKKLIERLKRHPKRVVFPGGSDPRILQAAQMFSVNKLGIPILVGNRERIELNARKLDVDMTKIRIIEPRQSSDWDDFVLKFQGFRRFRQLNDKEVEDYLKNPDYFATLMLATSQADAIVAGATTMASISLRPLLNMIPRHEKASSISSLNIFDPKSSESSDEQILFLADCSVIPDPNIDELSDIAVKTAALRYHLTNSISRVALLSYTNKSSSSDNPTVMKMKAATDLARKKASQLHIPMEIDGELQVDTALDTDVAEFKNIKSSVAGQANVLIFPDLHAANISLKLLQQLTSASNYGPILTGLTRPAAVIGRSSTADDIFGTAVTVASQAISHKLLYPTDNSDDLNTDVTLVK